MAKTRCLLLLRFSAKGLPDGDPCERQHPFRVGGKDFDEWSGGPPQLVFDCLRDTGVCGGVDDIGVGFQQWSVAGSQARKEDRVSSVVSGHAILGPGEPVIHLRCPQICRWWIYKCPADEGSRGCIGDGPRKVAGGCNGCFGCGVVLHDPILLSLLLSAVSKSLLGKGPRKHGELRIPPLAHFFP